MVSNEVSDVLWSVSGLVAVLAGAVILILARRTIKKFRFDAGPIHAQFDMANFPNEWVQVREAVTQINDAVNHRHKDAPTLVDRVTSIEGRMRTMDEDHAWTKEMLGWLASATHLNSEHLGVSLDNPPPPITNRVPATARTRSTD